MAHEFTPAELSFVKLMNLDDGETRILRTIIETAELRGWNRCIADRVQPLTERLWPIGADNGSL